MPNLDLITAKLGALNTMVNDLKANSTVMIRIGGHTMYDLGAEVDFQQQRVDNLTWAQTATDADINARISDLESQTTAAVLACKYGNVRGLSLEEITIIAKIEDLEIALGTHPAVQ